MSSLDRSKQAIDYVRTFVRNSPWISIAILLHVLIIAVVSVIYIAGEAREREAPPTSVSIAANPLNLPPPIETPPEIIDRNSVPVLPDQDEGPVNPDEDFIPDAAAGRQGEITDELDPTKEAGIYNPDPEALSNMPSGATGGTPIGIGTIGHHGTGTPSAYSSRRAGGGGKGGGGLGQGGGGGRGGSKRTEESVDAALQWLKNHQSPDGRWDADGFSDQCKKNTCGGPGYTSHDIGVTGLALLCFLGAGHTHDSTGSFKNTVKNGLKFLVESMDDEGCIGERVGHQFLYDHACAALALTEAYGMTQARPFKEPAQKAVKFILKAQNPYRAWRYAFPPDGDNDTSVTGWMVMVLKSAKMSQLTIDEGAYAGALNWVDEMTDPATGRTGYTDRGGPPSRLKELMDKFPAEKSEAMTAAGVLVRVFSGKTAEEDKMISAGAALMAEKLPKWDPDTGVIDFYYWYYGTLAMFQVGGPGWDKWNDSIKKEIVDHQRTNKDEDEYGSWDPIDAWSDAGGRIYSTAMNCLCMEVYYRYPKVFGQKKRKAAKRGKAFGMGRSGLRARSARVS